MAIQKPYNINVSGTTIDADEINTISWQVSGAVSVSFAIDIYNNASGILEWQLAQTTSYATKYDLLSNALVNGNEYKIQVTIWDELGNTATSDFVVFKTSSRPNITVDYIGTIGNASYTFIAEYSQTELIPLRSWSAYLYDSNKIRIAETGVKTTTTIEWLVNNLQSEKNYYIEFQVTGDNGLTNTSGLISFSVLYTLPQLSVNLSGTNVDNAGVKLAWSVIQIIGEANHSPIYTNEKIDLTTTDNKVWFTEGFSIDQNFTIKVWLESPRITTDTKINESDYLFIIQGQNGKIFAQLRNDNKFHVFKKINGLYSHYASEVLPVGTNYYACVQQYNDDLNVYAECV